MSTPVEEQTANKPLCALLPLSGMVVKAIPWFSHLCHAKYSLTKETISSNRSFVRNDHMFMPLRIDNTITWMLIGVLAVCYSHTHFFQKKCQNHYVICNILMMSSLVLSVWSLKSLSNYQGVTKNFGTSYRSCVWPFSCRSTDFGVCSLLYTFLCEEAVEDPSAIHFSEVCALSYIFVGLGPPPIHFSEVCNYNQDLFQVAEITGHITPRIHWETDTLHWIHWIVKKSKSGMVTIDTLHPATNIFPDKVVKIELYYFIS